MGKIFTHWNITAILCLITGICGAIWIVGYVTHTLIATILGVIFAVGALIAAILQWRHPVKHEDIPKISPQERKFLIASLSISVLILVASGPVASAMSSSVSTPHQTPATVPAPRQTPATVPAPRQTPTTVPVPNQVPTSTPIPNQAPTPGATCDTSKVNTSMPTVSSTPTNQELDAILNTYESNISYLVQDCRLPSLASGNPIRTMAQTLTISTINQLDATRNVALLKFLRVSLLIGSGQNVISFAYADFDPNGYPSGANMSSSNVDLSYTDLDHANLMYVNLNRANLSGADLSCANLSGADIGNVNFTDANLSGAIRADKSGFTREGEKTQGAIMTGGSTHC